jgi:flagellar hook-associated protein 3 FlgL
MSTRISTLGLHEQAVTAMLQQQARLAKVQQQLTTGHKLTRAADDPGAAAGALALDQALAELNRYGENAKRLTLRLSLEETALASAADVVARVRELAVAANSGSLTDSARGAIAVELRARYEELLALANSGDGAGRYLFGGTQDSQPPFAAAGGGIAYAGDHGQRVIAVAPGMELPDGDPGAEVFQRIRDGNGVFSTRADPANTGSAVVKAATLADPAQWDGDSYRIEFNAGAYQVSNSAAVVVASGAYVPGQAIEFAGVRVSVSGAPADGDAVVVDPSATQDIFSSLRKLIAAVETPGSGPAAQAARQNAYFSAQEDLAQALDHLVDYRALVGARLGAAESSAAQREAAAVDVQAALSGLRDLDYTEAVSRMNLLMTALQAAQQTYLRVQGSTLFDYLR